MGEGSWRTQISQGFGLQELSIPSPVRVMEGPCSGPGAAPADHDVDGVLHRQLQPGGGPAGPGGVVLAGGRGAALAGAPDEEVGPRGRGPVPSPAHLLTLAVRSSQSPSMALGETSKVATKVTCGRGRHGVGGGGQGH